LKRLDANTRQTALKKSGDGKEGELCRFKLRDVANPARREVNPASSATKLL